MKNVLIIEDDTAIADVLRIILSEFYTVNLMYRVPSIERLIADLNADLILLDMLIPGESGIEICKKLKRNPNTNHIPIIMMSAHPHAKKLALKNGADVFISKPFNLDNVIKIINQKLK